MVEQQGITRQVQDEFALRSQQKADAAYKEGRIQEELVPVPLRNHKGEATGESLTEDDHRRPQTTMEGLAKLKACIRKKWNSDCRQCERHCGWRCGGGRDVAGRSAQSGTWSRWAGL